MFICFFTVDQLKLDQGVELLTVAAASAATTVASAAATSATASALLVLVFVLVLWGANLTADRITFAQSVAFDHGHGDVNVVGAGQVAGSAHECVVVEEDRKSVV